MHAFIRAQHFFSNSAIKISLSSSYYNLLEELFLGKYFFIFHKSASKNFGLENLFYL